MPVHDEGVAEGGYATINSTLKKEIKNHVRDEVTDLATVMRTANNVISASDSFHYDSRMLPTGPYKFDVQFLKGKGPAKQKTVAVVLVDPDATSVNDFRTALANALDGEGAHKWRVS